MTSSPTHDLSGKVAVVTGAARGIGRACAVALARAGADVAGLDVAAPASTVVGYAPATPDDLAETGRLVEEAGGDGRASRPTSGTSTRHGITVNALVPGLVDTVLTRNEHRYAQAVRDGGGSPTGDPSEDEQTAAESLAAQLPLGVPWLQPDEIGPAVVFLASDAARMVSGSSLAVTGGDTARVTA